jgi:ubiquinone biosynthesis protein
VRAISQPQRLNGHSPSPEINASADVVATGLASSKRVPTPLPMELRRSTVAIGPARGSRPLRSIRVLGFLIRCALMFSAHLVTRRFDNRVARIRRARAFRDGIENLGGLWIKAGQLLGLRRDIFPEEFCDELSGLQDLADGFEEAAVRAVFHEELERQPEELFAEFDLVPVAAGSVGQVHTAITKQGLKVAVKVQRPEVQRVFQADFRYMRAIVWILVHLRLLRHGRWKEMLWELEQMMVTELDYRYEAANIRRMRQTLRAHKVVAPVVLSQFTTKRLLVMEYIEGVFMSDFIRAAVADPAAVAAWCSENNIDPRLVGWRLYQTHTRQVYEDNLFHSDLHPGNVVLLTDSRLALIDFGSIGSIDASKLSKYYMIFQAVAERDFNKVADLFLLLITGLPPINTDEVKSAIVRVMRTWEARTFVRDLPYHEKSLSHTMNEIARVFREHRVPIAWEFMRVNRAELTLDFSLMYLMPDANYYELIRRYERKARRRALRRAFEHDNVPDRVLELTAASRAVPMYFAENLQLDAEWVRRRGLNFEQSLGAASFGWKTVVRIAAAMVAALIGLLVLAFSERWVHSWVGEEAAKLINSLAPGLMEQSTAVWLLAIAGLWYVYHVLHELRRRIV